jgi:hypothetical protein
MIKVSIGVYSETARFVVAVQAESIQRALNIVESRYPGSIVKVAFPIQPEDFFNSSAA